MNLTLSQCFVIVHDPDLALGFYRDALGLEVRADVSKGDFRWITVGAASQPDVAIVLTNYLNGSPADNDAVEALVQPWGTRDFAIRDPSGNLVRIDQAAS